MRTLITVALAVAIGVVIGYWAMAKPGGAQPSGQLVCYRIAGADPSEQLDISDEFGSVAGVEIGPAQYLCVPAQAQRQQTATPSLTPVPLSTATRTPTAPALTPTRTRTPTPLVPTATRTPTPTTTPVPGGQPVAPITAAFYYPWFPETWPFGSNFTPVLGQYDTGNPAIVHQHLRWAEQAHLEAYIASWWGQGHHTDVDFRDALSTTTGDGSPVRWAIYHEGEGQANPSVSQIMSDLAYLAANATGQPSYLRVSGKPVVFVYAQAADGCAMIDRWEQANDATGSLFYLVLKVFPGYLSCTRQPDSWHQYGPAVAYDQQLPFSASVSPGFWKVGESPRLARDPVRFEADVQRAVASGAFWQLVTTWNEWGEGSIVEPATQFGQQYLDILCRRLPGPACVTSPTATPGGPTPTPLPTPTITATPIPGSSQVLIGAGDISDCGNNNDEATAALLDGIAGTVFTTGDNAYDSGTASQFTNCYNPTWGRHKGRTRPVPGNHDYGTSNASGYFDYFGPVACNPAVYCAYNLGDNWRVYQLNSEISHGAGSTQEQWLRADLAATPRGCVVALWHKPRFSSGNTHGSDSSFQPFWQALYDARADVVLVGHEHNYERFALQSPSGAAEPTRGLRQFVVGTGGRSHYGFGSAIANSEVRNSADYGVFKLTLRATGYDWAFIAVGGAVRDQGSGGCVP